MRASVLFFVVLVAALASCAEEEYPLSLAASQPSEAGAPPATTASARDASAPGPPGTCTQAAAGLALPQRLVTMAAASPSTDAGADADAAQASASADSVFLVSDLWQMYETSCGGPCHDHGDFGGFAIPHATDFRSTMNASVLAHVTSNGPTSGLSPTMDPKDPMPPFSDGGKPFSSRDPSDPIVIFATLVQEWLNQGSPANSFTVAPSAPTAAPADAGSAPAATFALTKATADTLTLIGNCIPNKALIATQETEMSAIDTVFAKAMATPSAKTGPEQIGLPPVLSQTDLFTLDSAVLAQHGVIAYAPAYPLWSDNIENGLETGKLRYVRVPYATSIQFDKATQTFKIPPNTRFYKTFMKRIVDVDGSIRYRKIETRLIVSRPDGTAADGTVTQNALYGTYKWNDDESDADIEQNALNDGQPFADDLITYVKDEQLSPIIRAMNPGDPDEAEIYAGSRKHYAIPSSQRCVECHMGSPSDSFVLGFTPVQINRRPVGQGGIVEAVGPDDLTQLQRLIDYGIVTGIDSASDVLPLERLEGNRSPRTPEELTAQGYMVGNCEHCHNPRGYPSVQYPVLAGVLDFLPGPNGGIFQFPLEKFSPRIFRGPNQNTPIPYITPSLMDLPPFGWQTPDPSLGNDVGTDSAYGPKHGYVAGELSYVLYAPWRSLIFRNTKSPFTYSEDFALFPHMPMNTPGYDVNAAMYMAAWMVSIPAIRKNPQIAEYALPEQGSTTSPIVLDDAPQPYVEVTPDDPRYNDAKLAAAARLSILYTGSNPALPVPTNEFNYYSYSPDTSDIVDPQVEASTCQTVPAAPINGTNEQLDAVSTTKVPDHAHWVITDLSEPQGPWGPRRPDWYSVLIPGASGDGGVAGGQVAEQIACGDTSVTAAAARTYEQQVAVNTLQTVTITDDFRTFGTTSIPFGLWQNQSGCTFPNVPLASSFTGSNRPEWMDNPAANVTPQSPVYTEWPGEAVFSMICINCHGPKADGTGRLADNLLTMTGGTVRVADLRDGIFGPVGNAGAYRQSVFEDSTLLSADAVNVATIANWATTSVDDRAARYLAWMGLGGTTAVIPLSILNIVADTSVLGVQRNLPSTAISANMLSAAKTLCESVLAGNPANATGDTNGTPLDGNGAYQLSVVGNWFDPDSQANNLYLSGDHELITANGDAELWLRLCSIDNPPPVRVATIAGTSMVANVNADAASVWHYWSPDLVGQDIYGPNPVGNDRGGVDPSGVLPTNLRPWCVVGSTDPSKPACPARVAAAAPSLLGAQSTVTLQSPAVCANGSADCWSPADADRWATRGAINAGMSVFLYLDALSKGTTQAQPDYSQCQLLQ
jgi:mono/diheme cytochrome c family protein